MNSTIEIVSFWVVVYLTTCAVPLMMCFGSIGCGIGSKEIQERYETPAEKAFISAAWPVFVIILVSVGAFRVLKKHLPKRTPKKSVQELVEECRATIREMENL